MRVPIILLLISAALLAATSSAYVTPTSGKYFYAQFYHDKAVSYVNFGVGSNEQPLSFLFNSEELTLAMFTNRCVSPKFGGKCVVPNPYDFDGDRNRSGNIGKNFTNEIAFLYQEGGITSINAEGIEMLTDFNITLDKYLRGFDYTGYAFAIQQITKTTPSSYPGYTSDLISGYIGFGPYTAIGKAGSSDHIQIGENFLYQLRQEGHIDHQVIAFFLNDDDEKESMVKIGSYDEEGFAPGTQILQLNTTNTLSWDVQSQQFSIKGSYNGDNFETSSMFTMTIMEPAYPFFYVPKSILDDFKSRASNKGVFQNVEYLDNAIRFNSPCNEVSLNNEQNLTIKYSEDATVLFYISELLVPSEHVQNSESGKCYIGIFPNTNAKQPDTIYLGQLYMKKYYTYFDVSGVQENGTSTLRIGTGVKNPNSQILQSNYNKSASNYDVRPGDQSKWTYQPNKFTRIHDGKITKFINKNTVLFVFCCVIMLTLLIILLILCIHLKRKSNKNRLEHIFKDQMTHYGKSGSDIKVRAMIDSSMSLDQGK